MGLFVKNSLPIAALLMGMGLSVARGEPAADKESQVVAYYFHTTARCSTCLKIEQEAREVIESDFGELLRAGSLVWKAVDVQLPENRHFVEDFKLLTKSLVFVEKNGKEPLRFKTLDRVWELVWDSSQFDDYVRTELKAFLGNH